MSYVDSSLAIVEYELDRMRSERNYIDTRIGELVEIRDKIVKEKTKEYERIEPCELDEQLKEIEKGLKDD